MLGPGLVYWPICCGFERIVYNVIRRSCLIPRTLKKCYSLLVFSCFEQGLICSAPINIRELGEPIPDLEEIYDILSFLILFIFFAEVVK